ncbi:MAG TPA: hypothetical protein VKN76_18340, partial [Kiloniellaceae bacterium]|nr:hypothetical protein [Kiloniellaceae bacterium]
ELSTAAAALGLLLRGGFHCRPEDAVPALPDGRPAASLVLLGNAGASLWPAFSTAPERRDGRKDPLDRWSARVIDSLAARFGAVALFPFGGPPYLPFQRWALRAEGLSPSPLGMLIHPTYGLWHAYRGALTFAAALPLAPRQAAPSPCETCAEKPCLSACPVGAFDGRGYDVPACVKHIASPAGGDCMRGSCLARRACPVGLGYRYEADQAAFHMETFLAARVSAKERT